MTATSVTVLGIKSLNLVLMLYLALLSVKSLLRGQWHCGLAWNAILSVTPSPVTSTCYLVENISVDELG